VKSDLHFLLDTGALKAHFLQEGDTESIKGALRHGLVIAPVLSETFKLLITELTFSNTEATNMIETLFCAGLRIHNLTLLDAALAAQIQLNSREVFKTKKNFLGKPLGKLSLVDSLCIATANNLAEDDSHCVLLHDDFGLSEYIRGNTLSLRTIVPLNIGTFYSPGGSEEGHIDG
jgi:PIN domain nuclease of toxin-antitoxin system